MVDTSLSDAVKTKKIQSSSQSTNVSGTKTNKTSK